MKTQTYTPLGIQEQLITPEVIRRIRETRAIDRAVNCPLYNSGNCFLNGELCEKTYMIMCDKYWQNAQVKR